MARPLRIEYAGALYHVTSRGNGQEDIYLSNEDRESFLQVVAGVCSRFNWVVHAYCLMSNHYHLVVETPDGNLSAGMRQLNGVYTQRFNRAHRRVGHVFQGRYKAILVEKDSYLLELSRYVVLNPVRAKMVRSAKDWAWSSYRATADLTHAPMWVDTDFILSVFGKKRRRAAEKYRVFVSEGKNASSPWVEVKNQIYLGSESFVEEMQEKMSLDGNVREIPKVQKRRIPKSLDYYREIFESRNDAIRAAYASGGYTMKAVGDFFGVHYSLVSRVIAQGEG